MKGIHVHSCLCIPTRYASCPSFCSLSLQLQFTARGSSVEEENYEWLYRGSARLAPVFLEKRRRAVSSTSHSCAAGYCWLPLLIMRYILSIRTQTSAVPFSPDAPFTFTDSLFDPECPPSTTPPDNTGIFPCSVQTPVKEPLPLGEVARMTARSKLQNSPSELQSSSSELKNSSSKPQNCSSELQSTSSELQSSSPELKNSLSKPQDCLSELRSTSSELRSTSSELRSASSKLQNSLSELHCDIPSSASNAAQVGPIVSRLPSPPSKLHVAEEPVPIRRKRAAPVQGNSTTKRSRSGASIEEICQLLAKRSAE